MTTVQRVSFDLTMTFCRLCRVILFYSELFLHSCVKIREEGLEEHRENERFNFQSTLAGIGICEEMISFD
jgi:hypothetical protein